MPLAQNIHAFSDVDDAEEYAYGTPETAQRCYVILCDNETQSEIRPRRMWIRRKRVERGADWERIVESNRRGERQSEKG
jgi:hypothetical protein